MNNNLDGLKIFPEKLLEGIGGNYIYTGTGRELLANFTESFLL